MSDVSDWVSKDPEGFLKKVSESGGVKPFSKIHNIPSRTVYYNVFKAKYGVGPNSKKGKEILAELKKQSEEICLVVEHEFDESEYLTSLVDDYAANEKKLLTKNIKKNVAKNVIAIERINDMLAPVNESYPLLVQQAHNDIQLFGSGKRSKSKPAHNDSGVYTEMNVYPADWHVGEIIDPVQVEYLNKYDLPTAAARAFKFAYVTSQWIDNYKLLHPLTRVNIPILGDMVSGMHIIHPSEADEYARIVTQCLDASLLLQQYIITLIRNHPDVSFRIVTTQGGNHPRSTRRMPSGTAAHETNWEHFMYHHLRAALQNYKIEWLIGKSYTTKFVAAGRNYDVMHGDAIKGGGGSLGIPAYGAKRQTQAQTQAGMYHLSINNDTSRLVQEVRTGHFHEEFLMSIPTGTFRICPSMKGTGAWELNTLGKISIPGQFLEVIHSKNGIIGSHNINLSDTSGLDSFVYGATDYVYLD